MKSSKRNFFILLAIPAAVFYGTSLVVSSTAVTVHERNDALQTGDYVRSLQLQLLKAVQEKQFAEAEMFFRRLNKLDKAPPMVQRLGSVALFNNGKLNEAETLLRNLLLQNPGDFICRNNYAAVLTVRERPQALGEFLRAFEESGGSDFVEKNMRYCAEKFKTELPRDIVKSAGRAPVFNGVPIDAVTFEEEKR